MSATIPVAAAADRLGVTRRTVDAWVARNANADRTRSHIDVGGVAVPVLRIGRRWVVVAEALETALRGEPVAS